MNGQEQEGKEEVGVTQASAFGVLGQAVPTARRGSPLPTTTPKFLTPIIRTEEKMEEGKVPTRIPRKHYG